LKQQGTCLQPPGNCAKFVRGSARFVAITASSTQYLQPLDPIDLLHLPDLPDLLDLLDLKNL
jgi:hypothetical protein